VGGERKDIVMTTETYAAKRTGLLIVEGGGNGGRIYTIHAEATKFKTGT
jgi:hypothetical protein